MIWACVVVVLCGVRVVFVLLRHAIYLYVNKGVVLCMCLLCECVFVFLLYVWCCLVVLLVCVFKVVLFCVCVVTVFYHVCVLFLCGVVVLPYVFDFVC